MIKLEFYKAYLVFMLFLISLSTQASSDGWTSSGGETLKDKINPWFLPNTKIVRYCILIDENNFGQNITQVRRRVHKSLQVWQQQLRNLQIEMIQGVYLPSLATQEFVETTCQIIGDKVTSNDADLFLQFGVLSGEQFRYLGDPTKYVGVTVRTDYDTVNLKAKGFIYFAPQNGPLKLNKVGLIEDPWSRINGALLVYPLLHEFGHIFGIKHNEHLFFMEESFLERWLAVSNFEHDDNYEWLTQIDESDLLLKIQFFKFDFNGDFNLYQACSSSGMSTPATPSEPPSAPQIAFRSLNFTTQPKSSHSRKKIIAPFSSQYSQTINTYYENVFNKFMGFEHDMDSEINYVSRCYSISKKNGAINFETNEKTNDEVLKPIGIAANLTRFEGWRDRAAIVNLWLPKEQQVIEMGEYAKNYLERNLNIGYMQTTTLFKGTYIILAKNIKRPFFIEAKTFGRMRFGGELDGVYYSDLDEGF